MCNCPSTCLRANWPFCWVCVLLALSCGLNASLALWFPPRPAALPSRLLPCTGECPAHHGCSSGPETCSLTGEQSIEQLLECLELWSLCCLLALGGWVFPTSSREFAKSSETVSLSCQEFSELGSSPLSPHSHPRKRSGISIPWLANCKFGSEQKI